jgi:outer membrane protein assembly factor BamD (BamD/ComL family)
MGQLNAESAGVGKARAQLRRGEASGALATLAALDREVPRGAMGQERTLIAIEALASSGQREVAAQRARRFIESFPNSPYIERVRSFDR